MHKLRSYVTFSNVIALCALFVALGGTSYAVTKIGSKQIRNNSVRSADIKNRTIKPRDIARGVIGATLQSTAAQATRDVGPTGVGASQNYTAVATLPGLEPGAYVLFAKINQSSNNARRAAAASRPRATWTTQAADCVSRELRRGTTCNSCTPSARPVPPSSRAAPRPACGPRPTRSCWRSGSVQRAPQWFPAS